MSAVLLCKINPKQSCPQRVDVTRLWSTKWSEIVCTIVGISDILVGECYAFLVSGSDPTEVKVEVKVGECMRKVHLQ